MRLLLDEFVPRRLKRELLGHDVKTVQDMGWAGIKNGALLKFADAQLANRHSEPSDAPDLAESCSLLANACSRRRLVRQ